MLIRPACKADHNAIAALHLKSWQSAYRDIFSQSFLSNRAPEILQKQWQDKVPEQDDILLVAEEQSQLSGFIAVWMQDEPFIDNLHVDPNQRGNGLGGQLLQAALEQLRAAGRTSAHLWVFQSNVKAIAFYKRHGAQTGPRQPKMIYGQSIDGLRLNWHLDAVKQTPR